VLTGGFDSLQGTCLQLEANLTKGVCMSIKPKIQDVLRILWKEVDGNDSATEFVAVELAHQLSTVLISILKSQFESNLPYPTLFETEFKLYKSDALKQKIATDPDSIKDKIYNAVKVKPFSTKGKIYNVVEVKPFSVVEKILSSKVLYSDSHVKVGHALIMTLLNLYKNPEIRLQNHLSLVDLEKIVLLLKDMSMSLPAEDAYALYQRCEEDADSYVYSSRTPLEYIYKHLSEEMRQREFESDSIRSLALCVFGVAGCHSYPTEAICKLINHKGWVRLSENVAGTHRSSLHYIEEVMVYMCKKDEVVNQSVISAFRENVHQFRPLFILEAMGNIIRTISYFPKPEHAEVLTTAHSLLVQAAVVQNLQN